MGGPGKEYARRYTTDQGKHCDDVWTQVQLLKDFGNEESQGPVDNLIDKFFDFRRFEGLPILTGQT